MSNSKIYSLFQKQVKNQKDDLELRIIISFESTSQRDKFLSNNKNLKILSKYDFIPSICVNLNRDQIKKYEKDKLIKQIEEDQRLFLSIMDFFEILNLNDYKISQFSYTGNNVKVGIIDTGIEEDVPSIYNSISKSYILEKGVKKSNKNNLKSEISHGTILASLICNQFKDSEGNFIGIAPNSKIFDFNITNLKQEYYFSNILDIFDLITKEKIELEILLISFTTLNPSDGRDILSLACDLLVEKGLIVVCPAGNNGPESYTIGSPSAAKNVLTIGSITKMRTISDFSGRGPSLDKRIKPDFCLPGAEIKIPISNDLTINATGTSVAAAICVGIIALIKEHNPNASYNEIKELFLKSSTDLGYDENTQGFGIPNIVNIFKNLNIFLERILPYNYLIKKALAITIEFTIIAIVIYYLFYFIMFI